MLMRYISLFSFPTKKKSNKKLAVKNVMFHKLFWRLMFLHYTPQKYIRVLYKLYYNR